MKLINQLQEKIQELENLEFKDEKEYDYYEKLDREIVLKNEILKFASSEIMKMLLVLERKDIPYSDIDIIIRSSRSRIDYDLNNNLKIFLILMEEFYKTEILNYIVFNKSLSVSQIIKEFSSDNTNEKINLTEKLITLKNTGTFLFNNKDNLLKVIEIVSKSELPFSVCVLEFELCKMNENAQEVLSSMIKDKLYYNRLTDKVKEKASQIINERNSFIKDKNNKIAIYKQCIHELEKLSSEDIISYDEEILNVIDEQLGYEFMITVLEHNRTVYSKLKAENLKNINCNNIEKLFLKNNISLSNLNEENKQLLLKSDIEKVEPIVNQLAATRWNWLNHNHPNFVNIILNTSIDNFIFLNYCLDNKIVTIDFIKENFELLLDKENKDSKFNTFKSNVYFYRKIFEKIDNRFIKNENAYLVENSKNLNIYELLKKYEINFISENIKYFSGDVFVNDKILDDLDSFIELGFSDYIKENSHFLKNESKDILTRLSIILNIGLDPYSKENRFHSSITSGKNFYVSQKELDNYKILTVDKCEENKCFDILNSDNRITISFVENEEIVKYLDKLFKKDELHYVINDYYISRNKFLRNLECLIKNNCYDEDAIYASLVYNSCLDDITIEYIKNTIKNYKEVKKLSLVN